ncbi:MAG: DUF1569 domain-containing protein [Planctomycetota bacterium]
MPTIDTTKVTDRRSLRFATLADLRKELDALEAAHRAGTLRTTGNWTPAQNLAHLAAFINYAYDGYPPTFPKPPWFIKLILKFMKKKYIHTGMPVGVKIPKVPGGTVGADEMPFESALSRFRKAISRLEQSPPATPNVIFGPLSHDEWKSMHSRHAELHLGFLHHK